MAHKIGERRFFALVFGVVYAITAFLIVIAVRHAALAGGDSSVTSPVGLSSWRIFAYLSAGALLIGFLFRRIGMRLLYELLLGGAVFLGVWMLSWSLLPSDVALLVASGMTVLQALVRDVWIHDFFVMLGAVGIALHLFLLFPLRAMAIIFLGVLFYDAVSSRRKIVASSLPDLKLYRGLIPGVLLPDRSRAFVGPIASAASSPASVFLDLGDLAFPLAIVAHASVFSTWGGASSAAGLTLAATWLGSRTPNPRRSNLFPLFLGAGIPLSIIFFIPMA